MKYDIIRHNEVGEANHGWLLAKHYFSFASYYNPNRMGFGKLLVLNDDIIDPKTGFGTHPHQDMEIISIPQYGAISHKDSTGNSGSITKGEVQVMSAGTGVKHSEHNLSKDEKLNLFQIWIQPNKKGVKPRYDQANFNYQDKLNDWTQLVSPMNKEKELGLKIHQEAYINAAKIEAGQSMEYTKKTEANGLFILVVSGEINISDQELSTRDAISIVDASKIDIQSKLESEVIVIEVPLT